MRMLNDPLLWQGAKIMNMSAQSLLEVEQAYPESTIIRTTLYELIEAISEEVEKGEEELIPKIVSHVLDSGKVRFIGGVG